MFCNFFKTAFGVGKKRTYKISDSNYFENRFEIKLFNGLIGLMEKWTVQFY